MRLRQRRDKGSVFRSKRVGQLTGSGRKRVRTDGRKGAQSTFCTNVPVALYKELVELLFHQPYTKGQFLVDAGIAKRKTAAEYLKELEKIGILTRHRMGKENLYLNVKLYELLSA